MSQVGDVVQELGAADALLGLPGKGSIFDHHCRLASEDSQQALIFLIEKRAIAFIGDLQVTQRALA